MHPPPPALPSDPHLLFETDWIWWDFAWLPDSQHIATAKVTGELGILDIRRGQRVEKPQRYHSSPGDVAWSSSGKRVAFTGPGEVVVQDTQSGRQIWLYQWSRPYATPRVSALSPDGKRLAFFEHDFFLNGWWLSVWDIEAGKQLWSVQGQYQGIGSDDYLLAWAPDGRSIASFETQSIHMWNASDGHLLWKTEVPTTNPVHLMQMSWSADNTAIAASLLTPAVSTGSLGPSLLLTWDAHTGHKLPDRQFMEDPNIVARYSIGAPYRSWSSSWSPGFAWAPAGARLAFFAPGSGQPALQVWDVQTGQQLFSGQPVSGKPGGCISWSPDGRYIAAGSDLAEGSQVKWNPREYGRQSTIQCWDAHTGKALFSYRAPRRPLRLTWSPDSRLLAAVNPKGYDCSYLCGYKEEALQVSRVP